MFACSARSRGHFLFSASAHIKTYNIDMSEALHPEVSFYRCMNDFFVSFQLYPFFESAGK